MELSDFETKSNRLSIAHQPEHAIALVETSSEEAENMDLKKRPSLKGLLANRNKGSTSREAPKDQVPPALPPPPTLPPADLGLHVMPNLKKKRPV